VWLDRPPRSSNHPSQLRGLKSKFAETRALAFVSYNMIVSSSLFACIWLLFRNQFKLYSQVGGVVCRSFHRAARRRRISYCTYGERLTSRGKP